MMIRNATKALLMVVAGTSMVAQVPKGFSAGVSLTNSLDSLKNVTNATTGYGLEFAYSGDLAKSEVPFRAALSVISFPGKVDEGAGLKQSLTNYQISGDVLIHTPWEKAYFLTGLSLNKWNIKSETANPDYVEPTTKGIKFGARFGATYIFSTHLSADLLVQITEFGVDAVRSPDPNDEKKYGINNLNPAWIQATVRYHF